MECKEISLHPESWLCGYLPGMKNNSKRGKHCFLCSGFALLLVTAASKIHSVPPQWQQIALCETQKLSKTKHTKVVMKGFFACPGLAGTRFCKLLLTVSISAEAKWVSAWVKGHSWWNRWACLDGLQCIRSLESLRSLGRYLKTRHVWRTHKTCKAPH